MDQVHDPLICRDLDMTRWNEGAEKLYSCLTLKLSGGAYRFAPEHQPSNLQNEVIKRVLSNG